MSSESRTSGTNGSGPGKLSRFGEQIRSCIGAVLRNSVITIGPAIRLSVGHFADFDKIYYKRKHYFIPVLTHDGRREP